MNNAFHSGCEKLAVLLKITNYFAVLILFLSLFFLFAGVFLSLLIFLSIAGNVLVCLAIYTERTLRRIGNLFLASLAIADLLVASLVMVPAAINDLLGMYKCNFFWI